MLELLEFRIAPAAFLATSLADAGAGIAARCVRAGHAFVGSAPPRLRDGSNSTPGPWRLRRPQIVL
jgi:hypothetical protein